MDKFIEESESCLVAKTKEPWWEFCELVADWKPKPRSAATSEDSRFELSNQHVKTLEHWILRVADSDMTWMGWNWLRPAKHERLGFGYVFLSSILLGFPGIAVGAGLIYLAFRRVEPSVWLWLFVLVMMIELPLHILFARFWNRRAEALTKDSKQMALGAPL